MTDQRTGQSPAISSLRLLVGGRVQGVGYRPYVYRLALARGLTGWVRNRAGAVEILAQGSSDALGAFAEALIAEAPPLARPRLLKRRTEGTAPCNGFTILSSDAGGTPRVHVPPDYFACDDCLVELRDPAARRHRYPFTNCTQCGPRYTLIHRLPYDRPNTAMAAFPLCPDCQSEYQNPADRRFHAQPLACPRCGPSLTFAADSAVTEGNEAVLAAALQALRAGVVVAVKGVGGYHLLCDARSEASVQRLRRNKPRPDKPLAVMYPQAGADGLAALGADLAPGAAEAALLRDPTRPIVLCRRAPGCSLAPGIAPGLDEVGAMLPYSPLHHLLLADFGDPLVATSGNTGGDPVLIDPGEAEGRLPGVAQAFLHHDRPILRPADDSVYRVIGGLPRPLRLGRGVAPLELELPFRLNEPVLAVGGHMKNTVALAWEDRAVVSPHIGELDTPRARRVFEQVLTDLQSLYGVEARRVVCDAHPGYGSSRWAAASGLPVTQVFHHHAHASALYGEHGGDGDWLVFTWDGVGLGEDGTLWGGETLLGRPGRWHRAGSLRPFRLPGGEKAGREPWRSALALCWEAGLSWPGSPEGTGLLRQAWEKGLNCPETTAAGRLFDAAAALLGLVRDASFEGQGPMYLEAAAQPDAAPIPLPLRRRDDDLWVSDWAPLLPLLLDGGQPLSRRAGRFHACLAHAMRDQARALRDAHGTGTVGLTGGVFQNRMLTEQAKGLLEGEGFRVFLAERLPCNDGGLCFGQVIEFLAVP